MFRQTYKAMYSRILPGEALLAETKNKMCSNSPPAKPNRMKWARLGAAAACLIIVSAAVTVLKPWQPKPVSTAVTGSGQTSAPSSAAEPEIKTGLQSGKYEPVVQLSDGVLNFIDSNVPQTGAKLYFDPKTTHEEQWTQEQMVKYLGKDVRPGYLPSVFTKTEQTAGKTPQFIVMNNDGTVAYDNISYYYNGDPDDVSSPSLTVQASKGRLPRDCVLYRSSNQTKSSINGHEISVGHEEQKEEIPAESGAQTGSYDLYFAEFLYEGIGYRVVSHRLPQEEFIKVLMSMVK